MEYSENRIPTGYTWGGKICSQYFLSGGMKSFIYLYEGIKSNSTIGVSIPVTDIFFANIYLFIFLCIEWCWKLTYLICKTPLPGGFWLDSAYEVWQPQRCALESPSKERCKEHSWLMVSSCATCGPIIGSYQGHTFPGLLLVSDWAWQEYYSLAFWSVMGLCPMGNLVFKGSQLA